MNEQRTRHARIQAFFDAFNNLSAEEKKLLRLQAHKLLSGTRYDHEDDLLNEAFSRAAEDRRQWKEGLHPAVFLYQSMRSIASIDRREGTNAIPYGKRHVSFEEWSMDDQLAALGQSNLSPELILIARENIEELERDCQAARSQLSEDPAALAILEARMEEASMREVKASLGLNDKQFKAADQRVRHALRRAKGRPAA